MKSLRLATIAILAVGAISLGTSAIAQGLPSGQGGGFLADMQEQIDLLWSALDSETTARINADSNLQTQIDNIELPTNELTIKTREAIATFGPTSLPGNSLGVPCHAGETAVGGGYILFSNNQDVINNFHVIASSPLPTSAGSTPIGWQVVFDNTDAPDFTLKVYATCAS